MIKENLFNSEGSVFMGSINMKKECSVGIFGVNYDGTTSFKPGTRFGPASIRNVSECLETYCPNLDKDLAEIKYIDFGALLIDLNESISVIKQVKLATNYLLRNNLKPLMLGGEHSITTGAVESVAKKYPELVLIQLDAHADLRNSYLNNKHSHACTMQRCIEKLPSQKIFQIGIRSGTKNEFLKMKENNQLIKFQTGDDTLVLENILNQYADCPIYLTIDLDWFDPSLLSGTGTPEPGGFFWKDFENIINVLKTFNIVAADIVELAPDIDPSGVSSVVAAKVARTIIMILSKV